MGTVVEFVRKDELVRQLVGSYEWQKKPEVHAVLEKLIAAGTISLTALRTLRPAQKEIERFDKNQRKFLAWQRFVRKSVQAPFNLFGEIDSICYAADRQLLRRLIAWCHTHAPAA